ncbi:hypothetical protein OH77DRAFT_1290675 [Trametes cingulata]|nr:hypothetical protein OH77DRAFT_1290675 [Trametes cingulata]
MKISQRHRPRKTKAAAIAKQPSMSRNVRESAGTVSPSLPLPTGGARSSMPIALGALAGAAPYNISRPVHQCRGVVPAVPTNFPAIDQDRSVTPDSTAHAHAKHPNSRSCATEEFIALPVSHGLQWRASSPGNVKGHSVSQECTPHGMEHSPGIQQTLADQRTPHCVPNPHELLFQGVSRPSPVTSNFGVAAQNVRPGDANPTQRETPIRPEKQTFAPAECIGAAVITPTPQDPVKAGPASTADHASDTEACSSHHELGTPSELDIVECAGSFAGDRVSQEPIASQCREDTWAPQEHPCMAVGHPVNALPSCITSNISRWTDWQQHDSPNIRISSYSSLRGALSEDACACI